MTTKERNLVKGAIRRVFSRSDLRRAVIAASIIKGYSDPSRPRVTKWSECFSCKQKTPTYQMEVDHEDPLVPLDKSLEDMTWTEVVDRTWCEQNNLHPMCKPCHKLKTKEEGKKRRAFKKSRMA